MKDTMIEVDLAKNLFQIHCATMTGHLKFLRKLARVQFRQFMSGEAPAVVVMEACGSASNWARELIKLGQAAKLSARRGPPQILGERDRASDRLACAVETGQHMPLGRMVDTCKT